MDLRAQTPDPGNPDLLSSHPEAKIGDNCNGENAISDGFSTRGSSGGPWPRGVQKSIVKHCVFENLGPFSIVKIGNLEK